MKLKEIFEKLDALKELSNSDPKQGDPRSYGGRAIAVNQAKESYDKLLLEHKNEILSVVFPIVVTGNDEEVEKFTEEAQKLGAIVVDYQEPYKKMATGMTRLGLTQYFKVVDYVNSLNRDNPELKIKLSEKLFDERSLPTTADAVNEFERVFETENGNLLTKLFLQETAFKQIVEKRIESKVVPLIVTNLKENNTQFLNSIFRKKHLTTQATTPVTTVFEQVKKIIKEK